MLNPDNEAIIEAIRAALDGEVVEKITITIKPKPTPKQK